jgi:hypothetical protein
MTPPEKSKMPPVPPCSPLAPVDPSDETLWQTWQLPSTTSGMMLLPFRRTTAPCVGLFGIGSYVL